ncbi:MAG: multiheme c-type cytochrome, partial [bacterium]
GGGRPSNTLNPVVSEADAGTVSKITGTVESPSGGLTREASKTAGAAVATTTVTLYNNGTKAAETTTSAAGAFSFTFSSPLQLSSLLLLSANSGATQLRAFVTAESVTINPASELVVAKVTSSGKSLSLFSVAELKNMIETAQNSYSTSCASSATVAACTTTLTQAVGTTLDSQVSAAAGTAASSFVGTSACAECHQDIAAKFDRSGHPYKLRTAAKVQQDIAAGRTPNIPIENFAGSPISGSWSNVSYVIGGFKWKARVIDKNGYIYTGTNAQYNFANGSQGAYESSVSAGTKKYTCGACHTTGWQAYDATSNPNRQDDLPGMDGTFAEAGVQCEACHGPGERHVNFRENMVVDTSASLCGSCHYRTKSPASIAAGSANEIDAKSGFIEHHEQWNEMMASPHKNMTCVSCHDPHAKASEGIVRTCESCHSQQAANLAQAQYMSGVACTECHMTEATKSALADSALSKGDVKTHIFAISTDPNYSFPNSAGTDVALDSSGQAKFPLTFACTKCHTTLNAAYFAGVLLGSTYNGGTGWDHKSLNVTNNQNPSTTASYVGSSTCNNCHASIYSSFIGSGHPYKLRSAAQAQSDMAAGLTPTVPITGFAGAPISGSWSNVSYVIGGFKWKARVIDLNGYVYTGTDAQYNIADGSQGSYESSVAAGTKKYTCGACHTTGWQAYDAVSNPNRQDNLPGMDGTFAVAGVQCEACHGAGSNHVNFGTSLTVDRSKEACGACHYRTVSPTAVLGGTANSIPASSGYIKHHEQYNEMVASPHSSLTCVSCHNPHKKASSSGGITAACSSCHAAQATNLAQNTKMSSLDCTDCHMAKAMKSALATGTYQADVMSHLVAISTDATYATVSGSSVALDAGGKGYIDLNFACQPCHTTHTPAEFKASLLGAAGTGTWDHKTLYNWSGQ